VTRSIGRSRPTRTPSIVPRHPTSPFIAVDRVEMTIEATIPLIKRPTPYCDKAIAAFGINAPTSTGPPVSIDRFAATPSKIDAAPAT